MNLVRHVRPGLWPALIVWAALAVGPALAQTFPALTGRVVDQAGVLSPQTEASLTQKLAALEARNGAQLVVATVRSLGDYEIRDYGYRLGRAWAIGQKGRNNGAILLVAPNDRQVAVEVGYGLEPVITDAYANRLLDDQVIPRFRAGQMEAGVVAGVDALVGQIGLDPAEAQARIAAAEARPAPREGEDDGGGIVGLLIGLFILWVVLSALGGLGRRGRRRRRRGGGIAGDVAQVVLWSILNSSSGGGRSGGGGWGGGGFGGGGGGGGFSGGGGSFGGGGASGSW